MISSATRHIYLVRHGQYEIGETEPQKRILTGMYAIRNEDQIECLNHFFFKSP